MPISLCIHKLVECCERIKPCVHLSFRRPRVSHLKKPVCVCLGVVLCIVWCNTRLHPVISTFFPTKGAKPKLIILQTSYIGTYLGGKTDHLFLKLHQSNWKLMDGMTLSQ